MIGYVVFESDTPFNVLRLHEIFLSGSVRLSVRVKLCCLVDGSCFHREIVGNAFSVGRAILGTGSRDASRNPGAFDGFVSLSINFVLFLERTICSFFCIYLFRFYPLTQKAQSEDTLISS